MRVARSQTLHSESRVRVARSQTGHSENSLKPITDAALKELLHLEKLHEESMRRVVIGGLATAAPVSVWAHEAAHPDSSTGLPPVSSQPIRAIWLLASSPPFPETKSATCQRLTNRGYKLFTNF